MPKTNPISTFLAAVAGKPPSSTAIRAKLASANAALLSAKDAYALAAAETEAGGDPAAEHKVLGQVQKLEADVTRLQAALRGAEAAEGHAASEATAKARAEQDAKTLAAFNVLPEAAGRVERATAEFVASIKALTVAFERANGEAVINRRVPSDALLAHSPIPAIKVELARVGGSIALGADVHSSVGRDHREIEPLAAQYAQLATFVSEKLGAVK